MLLEGQRYAWQYQGTWYTGLFTGQYDNCGLAIFAIKQGQGWVMPPNEVIPYKTFLQKGLDKRIEV